MTAKQWTTLSEIIDRHLVDRWQEAVSLVLELADLVDADGAELPADPARIVLDSFGTLTVLPGGLPAPSVVRHLAELLRSLTAGMVAPTELDTVIVENARSRPALDSVQAFTKALSFYARPDRQPDLAAIAARAFDEAADTRVREEFHKLQEKTGAGAVGVREATDQKKPIWRRRIVISKRLVRAMALAAAAALVVGGVGIGILMLRESAGEAATAEVSGVEVPAETTTEAPPSLMQQVTTGLGRLIEVGRQTLGLTPPPPAPPAPPEVAETPRAAGPARARSAAPATASPRTPATVLPRPAPSAPAAEAPVSARSRLRDEPSIEVNAAEYFSPTNGEVVPPVLERPQLPSEPPPNVPPENVGTLELYVNEEGLVDRVRLVSPANRYNERMIVAAAKAWRFRPAFRDGQPVKYRTIIRVTL